jgi:hypothetical protein
MPPSSPRRLADLLIDPHETLDVEYKEWIDIQGNNEHKATLAKALIALANHGGGFFVFGFAETAQGLAVAINRPANLAAYTPDTINSVVIAYAEPSFHCDLNIVAGPDGLQYPIISVPGGHRVPIKTKRDGPNGQIVRQNSYYIRRPGPQSEISQTGREWDELIARCISNGRSELLDQMRIILGGGAAIEPEQDVLLSTQAWLESSLARWAELVASAPGKSGVRFPHGHFAVAYRLVGALNRLPLSDLLEALRQWVIRHTGWPMFSVPARQEVEPYIQNGCIECWRARDGQDHGPAYSDFWRVSPDGKLFFIRWHQEDDPEYRRAPGKVFDIALPTWRVGEALLHAANMATAFGDRTAQVTMMVEWTGLRGRALTSLDGRRWISENHFAQQETFRNNLTVQADQIENSLPELVGTLVIPLYELFGFFRLPRVLPAEELARMRANRH